MADPSDELPSVTILVAHGSRNPRTAAAHAALCNSVAAAGGGVEVRPAFLEISEPSIAEAIDLAVAAGAPSIRVLPLFVHVGGHVERDIPAIVDAARRRHPSTTIELAPHIGADPAFVALIADSLR